MQARLLRRYLDSFPKKQAELEDHWDQVLASDWGADSLACLRTPVHRLAGSAGSYGLNELGRAARQLDTLLKNVSPTLKQRDDIQHQFGVLMSAVKNTKKLA